MTSNLHLKVTEFANCVAAQAKAIEDGDPSTGNKYAKRYVKAFREIQKHGDEGRRALAELFSDPRADVRVMAAAYLLRFCEHSAVAVLETEAKGEGLVAFGAAQALKRWRDGTWALDP
jgi:hypothetical protein